MSTPTIEQRIKKIVAEQLGIAEYEIEGDSNLDGDLGADSLDMVEIVMAIEDEFEVEIPDDVLEGVVTVQQAIDLATKLSTE